MKKLFLTLGLACLFMVACNHTPKQDEGKQTEQTTETTVNETADVAKEEHNCPMHALMEAYANWDEMTDDAKKELNQKAYDVFKEMDAKMEEMKTAGEEVCKEMAEMTEEQKTACEQKCAEMKAKWDNFANMTLDEQKDLIMERLNGCHGDKPCCKGEGEGHQCQHEGEEGHQCQHEAK